MSRLTRDGTAEPVSRDQILRHARGQRNVHFPCSADHEQDWQPYPVDPYSAICDDHTYIHTYIHVITIHTITRHSGDDDCGVSGLTQDLITEPASRDHVLWREQGRKAEIMCLKKNQTTPRPSEHPPVKNVKTFRWDQKAANTKPTLLCLSYQEQDGDHTIPDR